jgi:hypothetical protein
VTFHVTYTNPDGPAASDENHIDYGDGTSGQMIADVAAPAGGCKTPYGPWEPPAKKGYTVSFDLGTYPYKAGGTYTVAVSGNPGSDPCDQPANPYRDPKSASTTIVVSPS